MRTYLIRIALALLTFMSGVATMRVYVADHHREARVAIVPQSAAVIPPPVAPARRFWPEPRSLDLEFVDTESLAYDGYLVKRFYKKVRIEEDGQLKPIEVEVSYARLASNGKILATFDGAYHPTGNATDFALVSLLGTEARQLVVSQTVQKGGRFWIVSLTPPARVIFSSEDWGVGRGENIRVVDLDNDGVDEIVEESTGFYDLQDELVVGKIHLPEVVFKYDGRSKKYLPANRLHQDYLLRDIDDVIQHINPPARDNYDQLASVLRVTVDLIYAGKQDEAWALYDKSYEPPNREGISARVLTDLKRDPVYQFIYQNQNALKQTAEVSLPDSLRSTLDHRFPGWHYLKVDDEITSFLQENVSLHARPDLITGDFDGNGELDYAALIERGKNPRRKVSTDDSLASLVVFLRTTSGFKMHVLEPEGDYLTLMKRDQWDYDYETQQYFTYPHDAIFMGIFEKAGSSYIYEKGKFRSITTSD